MCVFVRERERERETQRERDTERDRVGAGSGRIRYLVDSPVLRLSFLLDLRGQGYTRCHSLRVFQCPCSTMTYVMKPRLLTFSGFMASPVPGFPYPTPALFSLAKVSGASAARAGPCQAPEVRRHPDPGGVD